MAAAGAGACRPGAQACHRQRARRLHERARVIEDVLDRRADLVVRHPHHLVHTRLRDWERQRADLPHGDAVGEDAHAIEDHARAGFERSIHGVGFERLHADHLDLGPNGLDVAGDTGQQPATADRHEDGREVFPGLAKDFEGHGALSGDHQGIVERMNHHAPGGQGQFVATGLGVGERVARQLHFGAEIANRIHLDLRRRPRHHDESGHAEVSRRERHALGMIAGAGGEHAARPLVGRQVRHAVVGAPQLEAEDRLQVFTLQEDVVAGAP